MDKITITLFIISIAGGIATLLSIWADIRKALSFQKHLLNVNNSKSNISDTPLNWMSATFWSGVSFFIITGICLIFSSEDFYKIISSGTTIIFVFIILLFKLIHRSILKSNSEMQHFIGQIKSYKDELAAYQKQLLQNKNDTEKLKKVIKDSEQKIQRATNMANLFAYNSFT